MRTIRIKLLLSFGSILLLLLILAALTYSNMDKVNRHINNSVKTDLPLLIAGEQLRFVVAQQLALARGFVLYGDADYKTKFQTYTEQSAQIDQILLQSDSTDAVLPLINTHQNLNTEFQNRIFPLVESGNKTQAMTVMQQQLEPQARQLLDDFESLAANRETDMKAQGTDVARNADQVKALILFVSFSVFLLGSLLAYLLTGYIVRPIIAVSGRMKDIAQGDFRPVTLQSKLKDEIGALILSMNETLSHLRPIIRQIRSASQEIGQTSADLSSAANASSQSSKQIDAAMEQIVKDSFHQGMQTEESSKAMEEMSHGIQQIAESASEALEMSSSASQKASEGMQHILQTLKQMREIETSVLQTASVMEHLSGQSQIIEDMGNRIKEIATQTNLLALNASIEAARAQEHGRGFSVVAGEIRKLAVHAEELTSTILGSVSGIQQQIAQSVHHSHLSLSEVHQGKTSMELGAEMFQEIVHSNRQVASRMEEIAASIQEMSAGSQQVSASLITLADYAKHSADRTSEVMASSEEMMTTMEHMASSSRSLKEMADSLQHSAATFILE
ncbi:methyl-accepting chemotaxis protein [Paenibacillus sedimenti]|uniref:Methyl-accepting chemotaxis protein n=1 Tax=Paenibacillus sedimenti TaxID=2770274 RepID=A0A926KYA9_9BACL|nr:methyl-accepting chemotaxis protein [Paenibacillus sedimenti]MBD0384488.1 methyl-accepting chemotaxis protein [Paenibacillus sedimenti]